MHVQRRHSNIRLSPLSSARPRLPPELCDIIIDFLHPNRTALASCSLVCKSWTPASRYHLWRSMHLTTPNISSFLSILPGSNVLPYVQTFKIDNAFKRITHFHEFWSTWERIVPYLSTRLVRLRCFKLSDVSWGLLEDMKWSSSILYTFSGVSELSLSNVSFHDASQVIKLLRNFPRLSRLTLAVCFSYMEDDLFSDLDDSSFLPLDASPFTSPWASLQSCQFVQGQLFDVFGLHLSSRQDIFTWMSRFNPSTLR